MFKYESFHIYFTSFYSSREIQTQNIDLAPNVWLHISVGRPSRRQSGGHGFESRLSLIVFSLLPSSCLNCDILKTDSLATPTFHGIISIFAQFWRIKLVMQWCNMDVKKQQFRVRYWIHVHLKIFFLYFFFLRREKFVASSKNEKNVSRKCY